MTLNLPQASDSFVCDSHGLRLGTPKEGPCPLCTLTCEGCGEVKDFPHLDPNAGSKFDHQDPHKDCKQKTDGFFFQRNCQHGSISSSCSICNDNPS